MKNISGELHTLSLICGLYAKLVKIVSVHTHITQSTEDHIKSEVCLFSVLMPADMGQHGAIMAYSQPCIHAIDLLSGAVAGTW